ncbi:MAG: HDOD domain-containing protein [Betaproteobacteria bacterium]|nr:MAG: HDOD domain-containing protein [Betaproteobacteria bacterium]
MQATLATQDPTANASSIANVDALIDDVEELLSLPDAAIRLNTLLTDPDATTAQIAEVVSLDPALAARVLRAVNSAYFGLRSRVDTISKAITMIGTSELHSLVLATSAAQAFKNISCKLIDMETFWQHSVRAALAARGFSESCLSRHRERVFLAALMHDIGKLVLYHQLPAESGRVLEAVNAGEVQEEVELSVLGYTHADVGAALLERWNLPASLAVPVRYHHRYAEAPQFAKESALIYLGSEVAHLMEKDRTDEAPRLPDADGAWTQAGCLPSELQEVMIDVDMHWLQVIEIVAPGSLLLY